MKKIALILSLMCLSPILSYGQTFKIGLMQAKEGEGAKYRPLLKYLSSFSIDLKFIGFRTYPDAAKQFSKGTLDGMFSGSGIAGAFIIKEIAIPLVRPIHTNGWSTYWAVIITPKGSPVYNHKTQYFKDKKVICSALASSGEFYLRSISNSLKFLTAGSHGMALRALSMEKADIAIVKNRIWDTLKKNYPGLVKVGEDKGENPNNTLIISKKSDKVTVNKLKAALLALKTSKNKDALAVKKIMNIQGYIPTTRDDFGHTLSLLKKAGVSASFNFK